MLSFYSKVVFICFLMLFCRLKTALIGHVQYHCLIFTTANTCTGHVQYHFLIFTIANTCTGHVQYHFLIFTIANTCTGHVQYHCLIFTIVNVDIVSSDLPLYEVRAYTR